MSMRGMAIDVTLSLTDRFSAPLKGAIGHIERLAAIGAAAHAAAYALPGLSQSAQRITMQSTQAFMAGSSPHTRGTLGLPGRLGLESLRDARPHLLTDGAHSRPTLGALETNHRAPRRGAAASFTVRASC